MRVYVRIKALKKSQNSELKPYSLPKGIRTVRELITAFVHIEVEQFNQKDVEPSLLLLMSEEEIEYAARTGRVSFGRLWSDQKADETKSIETAISAFRDGLFRVLMDEIELTDLDTPIIIQENAVFTFIRLTFLAGRMW